MPEDRPYRRRDTHLRALQERKVISHQHFALFKGKRLKATASPAEQRPRPWEEAAAAPIPLEREDGGEGWGVICGRSD